MPKPLDQVLKEAVADKTPEYQKEFLSSSREEQIKKLNEENEKIEKNIDILSEVVRQTEISIQNGEENWVDYIESAILSDFDELSVTSALGALLAVSSKTSIVLTSAAFVFLAIKDTFFPSPKSFIAKTRMEMRRLALSRGKLFLAIQELGGERKATNWDKRKEETRKTIAKKEEKKQERKAFDEKIKEKRKKKIKIGDDVSGFVNTNENVESKTDSFTPYTLPSMAQTPQSIAADAELKKVESVTPPEKQPQAQPKQDNQTQKQQQQAQETATPKPTQPTQATATNKTEPQSKYLPQIKIMAGLSEKQVKDLVMKHYEGMDLSDRNIILEINGDILRARSYSNYAKEFLKPDGEYSTEKDRKELEQYLFESEYHTPFIKKIFGIDSTQSTALEAKTDTAVLKEPPKESTEKDSQINYNKSEVQAKIEKLANESDKELSARIKEQTKNKSALTEDTEKEKAIMLRDKAQQYSKIKDEEQKAKIEQFFAQEFNLSKTDSTERKQPEATPKPTMAETKQPEATPKPTMAETKQSEATPKPTMVETKETQKEPEAIAKKESTYDSSKVQAHIEKVANESDEELEKRVKSNLSENMSERMADAQFKKAKFHRRVAQEYLKEQDPVKKKNLEGQFVGKVEGIDPKDHIQHLTSSQEKTTQEVKKQELPQTVAKTETTIPTPIEPKAVESPKDIPSSELTASTKKSGIELDAVRESMVEDKMASQQSQPIVVPVPIPMGGRSAPVGGGDGSSTDSLIPMTIVNDEEIIRMNSFEAYKLRMI